MDLGLSMERKSDPIRSDPIRSHLSGYGFKKKKNPIRLKKSNNKWIVYGFSVIRSVYNPIRLICNIYYILYIYIISIIHYILIYFIPN